MHTTPQENQLKLSYQVQGSYKKTLQNYREKLNLKKELLK